MSVMGFARNLVNALRIEEDPEPTQPWTVVAYRENDASFMLRDFLAVDEDDAYGLGSDYAADFFEEFGYEEGLYDLYYNMPGYEALRDFYGRVESWEKRREMA